MATKAQTKKKETKAKKAVEEKIEIAEIQVVEIKEEEVQDTAINEEIAVMSEESVDEVAVLDEIIQEVKHEAPKAIEPFMEDGVAIQTLTAVNPYKKAEKKNKKKPVMIAFDSWNGSYIM